VSVAFWISILFSEIAKQSPFSLFFSIFLFNQNCLKTQEIPNSNTEKWLKWVLLAKTARTFSYEYPFWTNLPSWFRPLAEADLGCKCRSHLAPNPMPFSHT
jgi:hypothetical protein